MFLNSPDSGKLASEKNIDAVERGGIWGLRIPFWVGILESE
jgi:hypothetical protein